MNFNIFHEIGPFLLPLLLIVHDLEEIVVHRKWILKHGEGIKSRFPKFGSLIDQLTLLSTKAFSIAVAEELAFILLVIGSSFVPFIGLYVLYIWTAIFFGFGFHLVIHIGQAIIIRNYVPGLITSFVSLPLFYVYAHQLTIGGIGIVSQLLLGICGLLIIVYNLMFAHWLGKELA